VPTLGWVRTVRFSALLKGQSPQRLSTLSSSSVEIWLEPEDNRRSLRYATLRSGRDDKFFAKFVKGEIRSRERFAHAEDS
jgi:hypothetical protein